METTDKILIRILKDFTIEHTITSLAKETGLSRVGVWKILKKIEADRLINLKSIGNGRTSTYIVNLNWSNILTEKKLELLLIEEVQSNQRWIDNFKGLESQIDFLILFGSILHSSKQANDIDLLIVTDKKNLSKVRENISKIQKSQVKKIHLNSFTISEFKEEINKKNKVFIDAIKKGIVLFGQEKFIKLLKETKKQ